MADDEEDFYALLGVDAGASSEAIRKAYRQAAVRWHPDKNPDDPRRAEVMFKKVAAAYEVLGDETRRAEYDRFGRSSRDPRGGANGAGRSASSHGAGATGPGRAGGGFGGFGAGGFHHDPFEIFREAFGGRDPFADDFFRRGGDPFLGDPFFADARARGGLAARSPFGAFGSAMGFGRDPFFEAAFGGSVAGGGGGFAGGGASQGGRVGEWSAFGGGGGVGKSTSTRTVMINGRRATRTTTTIRHADGREETFTDEHVDEGFPEGGAGPRALGGDRRGAGGDAEGRRRLGGGFGY
jgi:DnaJ family protein B protein 6